MRTKIHAKVDQDTIQMLQRCRAITGYQHYDELIKFMATFTVQSYIEARTRMANEERQERNENKGETGRGIPDLLEPSAGSPSEGSAGSPDVSTEG